MKQFFTLVELLVVIAIISILASLLLPTLKQATDSSRLISCMSQHKQLHTANIIYADNYNDYFVGYGSTTTVLNPWAYTLYHTGAMQSLDIYFCPAAQYSRTETIPGTTANWVAKPTDSYRFFSIHYGLTISTQPNDTKPDGTKLTSVKKPTEKLFLADAENRDSASSIADYRGCWKSYRNYFTARHGNGSPAIGETPGLNQSLTNFTFVDGHVETIIPSRLMEYWEWANYNKLRFDGIYNDL